MAADREFGWQSHGRISPVSNEILDLRAKAFSKLQNEAKKARWP
jgi:hypothetical protein